MPQPSSLTDVLFFAIVVLVAAFYVAAILRTARPGESRGRTLGTVTLLLAVSLVVPGALAGLGLLDRYDPMPAPGLLVVLIVTICTLLLAFSRVGARLATGLPLAVLVGYQVFRVPLEVLLHRLYVEGVIPVEMTYEGRNFDVVTGLTAAVLAILLAKGRASRKLVIAWNALGLVLLANIVAVAVLATPTPFQLFTDGPPNLLPSMLPYVWLPTVLVQAALLGHLLVFRAMRLGSE
ncbi:MAG: hypothetical protein ABL963_09155 [Longimicrobiales bacterium]